MRRDQLEHAIRTACQIAGTPEVIVVGSQAILGTYREDELPDAATMSAEIDILPIADDGMQLPQDRCGDDGLRLGRGQLVLLSAGQEPVRQDGPRSPTGQAITRRWRRLRNMGSASHIRGQGRHPAQAIQEHCRRVRPAASSLPSRSWTGSPPRWTPTSSSRSHRTPHDPQRTCRIEGVLRDRVATMN
jgi:hypothetical protein